MEDFQNKVQELDRILDHHRAQRDAIRRTHLWIIRSSLLLAMIACLPLFLDVRSVIQVAGIMVCISNIVVVTVNWHLLRNL